ncbi:MAG: hypothetical protein C0483_17095 [Pirellula sp.]|nr:hypothetical protein [Pirellula sp.]
MPKRKRNSAASASSSEASLPAASSSLAIQPGIGEWIRRRAWWIVGICGCCVRVLYIGEIRSSPFFNMLPGDAAAYDAWAHEIAGGDVVGRTVFYQAPLYPYFLALVYTLTGGGALVARYVQALLGGCACVLLGKTAERWFDRRTGLTTAWLLALNPTAIFFDGVIQKTALETFLTTLFLWSASRTLGDAEARPRRRLVAGFALGLLCLARENAVIWIPVLFATLWWCAFADNRRRRAVATAWCAAGLMLPLGVTAVRNFAVGGTFAPTTSQFGSNFYIGNHAGADGLYHPLRPGRGQAKFERVDAVELAEASTGRKLRPSEVSQYWFGQAWNWIRTEPAAAMKLLLYKLRLAVAAVEIGDTEDQYAYADDSMTIRTLGTVAHFGVVLPAAIIGAVATWKSRRALILPYALFVSYAMSTALFYVFARYRFPLVVLSLPFAAAGILACADAVRMRNTRQLAIYGICGLVAAVGVNWPIPALNPDRFAATSYYNLGVEATERSQLEIAEFAYQRAVARWPQYAAAWNNLGELLHRHGRDAEAARSYASALEAEPHFGPALNNRGILALERGDGHAAESDFRAALADPLDAASAHVNLGNLALRRGNLDEATFQLEAALKLRPNDSGALINLGNARHQQGRLQDAEKMLRTAVDLAPQRVEARQNLGNVLAEQGRREEAIAEFRSVLAVQPALVAARISLGQVYLLQGRAADAEAEFRTALSIAAPESRDAAQLQELLRRAEAAPR